MDKQQQRTNLDEKFFFRYHFKANFPKMFTFNMRTAVIVPFRHKSLHLSHVRHAHTFYLLIGFFSDPSIALPTRRAQPRWWLQSAPHGPPSSLMICLANVISGSLWSVVAETGKRKYSWLPVGVGERPEAKKRNAIQWFHREILYVPPGIWAVGYGTLGLYGPVRCCRTRLNIWLVPATRKWYKFIIFYVDRMILYCSKQSNNIVVHLREKNI